MKSLLLLTLFTISLPPAFACSEVPTEYQVSSSPATRRLLAKVGAEMSAVCELPESSDDPGSPVTINFTDYDRNERTSGTVTRSFTGKVECTLADDSVVDRRISGRATFKFWISPADNTSCSEQLFIKLKKINVSMKY